MFTTIQPLFSVLEVAGWVTERAPDLQKLQFQTPIGYGDGS